MPDQIVVYDCPMKIIKQANGLYRWFGVSSVNTLDRDNEIVSETALVLDVHRTKQFTDDSCLLFFHFDGGGDYNRVKLGGAPDYRAIVDGHLIETGEFDDTVIGRGFAKFIQENPRGIDGKGWGMSIGFDGIPDKSGVYHLIQIKERSVLPLSSAANPFTSFGVKGLVKMALNEQQIEGLKLVERLAKDPETLEAVKMIVAATDQSKALTETGITRKATDAAAQTVPPSAQSFPMLQFNQPGSYNVEVAVTPQEQLGFETKQATATPPPAATQPVDPPVTTTVNSAAPVVVTPVIKSTESDEDEEDDETDDNKTDVAKGRYAKRPPRRKKDEEGDNSEGDATDSTLTDEELSEIVKYVDERINQKLEEIKTLMVKMTETAATLTKATETLDAVKQLNTQPVKSIAERLKALSGTNPAAIPAPTDHTLNREKGANMEADPGLSPESAIKKQLGF